MENDNPFDGEELPPGASVFGDDELPTGASVFGDDVLPAGSSVFGDVDPDIGIDAVPIEAVESPTASVFGDVEPVEVPEDLSDSSPILGSASEPDEAAEPEIPEIDLDSTQVSMPLDADDIDLIDDGSDDPVELPEGPGLIIPDDSALDSSDGIQTGEPIALNVDPDDDDGLEAWSDLGAATEWGDGDEALDLSNTGSWDPAMEAEPEPQLIKIGEADSQRFFELDDSTQGSSAQAAQEIQPQGTGADLQPRIITGVALLALAIVAFTLSPLLALVLIVVVVAVGSGELFNALRVAGYQPATLLGLAASVAMPLAVYFRGTQAVALILALTVVFGLLWYLSGVATDMPVMNLGVTLLGVCYVGVLGSFGAAMLDNANRSALANDDGTELLLISLVLTIAYDVGAYFSGRSMGRTPLTAVSPNKTVEGLIGGAVMTIVASVVFVNLLSQFTSPVSDNVTWVQAFILGVAAAIMAPLGDLAESLLKRDLGIKDMGSILPGHGGILDRIDALLFVLPTVYFFGLAFVYA